MTKSSVYSLSTLTAASISSSEDMPVDMMTGFRVWQTRRMRFKSVTWNEAILYSG